MKGGAGPEDKATKPNTIHDLYHTHDMLPAKLFSFQALTQLEGPKPIMTTQRMQSHNSNYQVHRIFNKSGLLALYPGSTELSVASSTVKWAGPGYEVTGLSKLPLS